MKPAQAPAEKSQVLARFDLRDSDYVGRVLFATEPDRSIEERFFPGWRNILSPALQRLAKQKTSSTLQVIEDQNKRVLEWPEVIPCLLVVGNEHWADYEVACEVRCVRSGCHWYDHDESTFDREGKTGIALRVRDSRRHYFAGFQAGRRLMIAARDDSRWIVLANADFPVDRRRYHQLAAQCIGREISVSVDGKQLLSVKDDRWQQGAAGLYTNTVARWNGAEIRCMPSELKAIKSRQAKREKLHGIAKRNIPQAAIALEIELPSESRANFGCVLRSGQPHLVVDWPESVAGKSEQVLLAVDLKGRELWRQRFSCASEFYYTSDDIDNDGAPEVVVLDGNQLYVLDGNTGAIRHRADYPAGTPFFHFRGAKARFNNRCPKIWRTGGPNEPARVYLFEYTGAGGHTIWSYDHELRQRWVHHNHIGKYGHDLTHYDVDDDGRDEIVAGYYTLNDEGKYVWRIEDQDMIYKQDHTDNLWVGKMAGEQSIPRVIAVAGESGVLFLNARNGKLLKRVDGIGHIQRIAVGRFRHDLPGKQAWVWTDWGSPGIYFLLDENGNILHRFQPDARCTDGATITWWPDGRQLLLVRATPEVRGLWDSSGWKVVDLSKLAGTAVIQVARLTTAAADQLVTVEGTRLRVIGSRL